MSERLLSAGKCMSGMNPSLNRNQMKYIAIIAMLIDHIAMFFVPSGTALCIVMRAIGRLTGPTMCFFLVEGYLHTRSKAKYAVRLFLFAIIAQFAYSYAEYGKLFTMNFSMIYTLFVSFVILLALEYIRQPVLRWAVVIVLIAATAIGDWGIFAPLFVICFYKNHDNEKAKYCMYAIVVAFMCIGDFGFLLKSGKPWYQEIWMLGCFAVIPFLKCYNGQGGRKTWMNRWFFYIFYPAHLIILKLISTYLV